MERAEQSSRSIFTGESSKHSSEKYWKYPQFIFLFIGSVLIILAAVVWEKPSIFFEKEPVQFNKNNLKEFLPIYSGDIHYSRFPKQYWEHRILMMKAMGLNSLGIYVMWNYHEIEKGKFDFKTGNRDLAGFLQLARKHEMNVLLRPGPYICGEWDFGGIPARLLGVKGLQIRTNNKLYEDEVKLYFSAIAPIIRPYLHVNGGNIILLQIQNELGSFSANSQYTQNLVSIWKDLDIQCEYYIEDGFQYWQKHYFPGAHIGLSGGEQLHYYTDVMKSPKFSNESLVFGGQIYTGWLTHWGENWNGRQTNEYIKQITELVKNGRSINLFMAYGGTNFGLTAGANGFPYNDYMPHITSYDYDSPINEQGGITPKYLATRKLLSQIRGNLPDIPAPIKAIKITPFKLQLVANLFANLPAPSIVSNDLYFFESDLLKMYDQGIVIYETILPGKTQIYDFNVTVRDFALFFIDDVLVTTINRQRMANYSIKLPCNKASCQLKILVEAMGHINYGVAQLYDRKGLIELRQQGKTTQESVQFKWKMTKVPINNNLLKMTNKDQKRAFPSIMRSQFNLKEIGDTFFDMSNYKKGYLWINGHLLGRYWNAGPQKRLYCPGTWLKLGTNEIEILELLTDKPELLASFETQY